MEDEFTKWLVDLQALFTAADWPSDYVESCGSDCWREGFDDGLSPQEQFDEEILAAHQ